MNLRTITKDGEPWFVAKDIAGALGFRDAFNAVQHLDSDEQANLPLAGFARGATIVNESGLYSLILRSRKPEAKAFRKWVTSVVLPSIRKDGIYIAGQEKPIHEDMTVAELVAQMAAMQAVLDARNARAMEQLLRHQEEKLARYEALHMLKRKPGRRTARKAPKRPSGRLSAPR